jgi:RNA polymerase sigma factor (sigma-70 family)
MVPRKAPAVVFAGGLPPHLLRMAPDARLVTLIRAGRMAAFEVVYDRHHRGILSFCRHMLSDVQEAEDAVQHTFLAAYSGLLGSEKPIQLRPWLFAIARNRCYSILRARREQPAVPFDEAAGEGLAVQVQRRQDLRDLVLDMRRLPPEQRAALVLAELDALSHEQIGAALGVPREKVKALVFQARESLVANRVARETDCADIRTTLATQRGGALRRGNLRRHLHVCPGCREFRRQMERQRRQLAVLLPVAPAFALKEAVLAGAGCGAGAGFAGGAGILASAMLKSGLIKSVGIVVAGVGTAGTIVATDPDLWLPSYPLIRAPNHLASSLAPAADARLTARTAVKVSASRTGPAGPVATGRPAMLVLAVRAKRADATAAPPAAGRSSSSRATHPSTIRMTPFVATSGPGGVVQRSPTPVSGLTPVSGPAPVSGPTPVREPPPVSESVPVVVAATPEPVGSGPESGGGGSATQASVGYNAGHDIGHGGSRNQSSGVAQIQGATGGNGGEGAGGGGGAISGGSDSAAGSAQAGGSSTSGSRGGDSGASGSPGGGDRGFAGSPQGGGNGAAGSPHGGDRGGSGGGAAGS